MKLDAKEFKRFKELNAKHKAGKATPEEEKELSELMAKRNDKGSNDLAWWKNYPELLRDAVNLPFNWIPGTAISATGPSSTSTTLNLGTLAIAKLDTAIGRSTRDEDAFNAQVRQLWIDMHRKYRGLGAYQKSDLGIMLLAVNSYFETIAKFERIYGVLNTYHIGNRVVPYGLKDALGISDALEQELAQFRYVLNLAIEKSRQLCLPKGLSVLMADIVAVSNLFKDSANRRAFIFGYDTAEFGIYDATTLSTGGCVKYQDFEAQWMNDTTPNGYNAFNLQDISGVINAQLTALLNDDDITIMCSDLLAAYGPENVMTLIPVPEDYKVEPVQDYERSLQFHNLNIVGNTATIYENAIVDLTTASSFLSSDYRHVIYQSNNTVMCRIGKGVTAYSTVSGLNYPYFTSSNVFPQAKQGEIVFDTWVDNPGELEIMCGTRYTALGSTPVVFDSTKYRSEIYAYGTKIVRCIDLFTFNSVSRAYQRYRLEGSVIDSSSFASNYASFCHLMQMDWAPILYINDSGDIDVFGDIDNFTKIDEGNLNRIHEVALLSGYKIPMVSKE